MPLMRHEGGEVGGELAFSVGCWQSKGKGVGCEGDTVQTIRYIIRVYAYRERERAHAETALSASESS